MAALEAARRVAARGVRRARNVVEDPRGLFAAGALAAGLVYYALYTESDSAECTLDEARRLDSDAAKADSQEEFDTLMENWTKAAALYLKESCTQAKYKLGRLCFEGRGYMYDPELGFRLYESAAVNGNHDAQFALAMAMYFLWTRLLQDAKSENRRIHVRRERAGDAATKQDIPDVSVSLECVKSRLYKSGQRARRNLLTRSLCSS
jgi:TPR repeat protein